MEDGLLVRHIERFNEAVRSGDYAPMLSEFAPEAEMVWQLYSHDMSEIGGTLPHHEGL